MQKMQTPEEQVRILTELGLTSCEAKVYLAIASVGTCTAKSISKSTHVSKPDVYRSLRTLQDRALIERIIGSPTLFKALPIGDTISLLLERKNKEFKLLREQSKQLKQSFKSNLTQAEPPESEQQFILISGKEAELERRRKETRSAKKSIEMINSWKRFPQTAFFYAEDNKEALQRGVKIRVITEGADNKANISQFYEDAKKAGFYRIRYVSLPISAVVSIYDEKNVIITTSPAAMLGEASILWSNNTSIVRVMQEYFEMLWAKAKPR
jgi:HTH-type transcriptional regulator, sugar sensing transcriptional regulator